MPPLVLSCRHVPIHLSAWSQQNPEQHVHIVRSFQLIPIHPKNWSIQGVLQQMHKPETAPQIQYCVKLCKSTSSEYQFFWPISTPRGLEDTFLRSLKARIHHYVFIFIFLLQVNTNNGTTGLLMNLLHPHLNKFWDSRISTLSSIIPESYPSSLASCATHLYLGSNIEWLEVIIVLSSAGLVKTASNTVSNHI